ncbi:hypothetical protein E2562_002752 [Oryza meyeriana var. granulata]|uniref:Uncharacterized protein n=1 Tax=Oryza meyeriana var. granulata TaxID=110450 RepID=A0A6G1BSE8_9ORYZ|nr:hypothetical protein E2562_002752 [Oryza meyeriana var. granulata]
MSVTAAPCLARSSTTTSIYASPELTGTDASIYAGSELAGHTLICARKEGEKLAMMEEGEKPAAVETA